MVIGIPTAPRPQNIDYLRPTLMALLAQIQFAIDSPMYNQVHIIVMNMKPGQHPVYDEAKEEFSKGSASQYFTFVDNDGRFSNINIQDSGRPKGLIAKGAPPTVQVRKQSLDVSTLLDYASGKSSYYLFMEDDFELCSHGMKAINYVMDKATLLPLDWSIIRISYGLNGVIMKGQDVAIFSKYLRDNLFRRPPDHLSVEWYAKEVPAGKAHFGSRQPVAFRYNLFKHLGVKSTLRSWDQPKFPGCFEELLFPTVFEVEAFNVTQCGADDITPCNIAPEIARFHRLMKFV
eukprot:TRINITY_DN10465_c0_g2_i1.p1 TRINITY_DN10465_c0_g2~~TRINITY_DN10465_c0_g2_i1.p1  ORF type:complete len:289 (+),score=51.48 TRINITY_DN10465_c0_g2_i1:457-1323(+)